MEAPPEANETILQRKFVIGDIHGAFKALRQVFQQASFDPSRDMLICLGDICDRHPDVDKVMDLLLTIKNLILLLGNHDYWALDWFTRGRAAGIWVAQGGGDTMDAYPNGVPENHVKLLQQALLYYEMDNRLFVHGGYPPGTDIREHKAETLLWDRSLIKAALNRQQRGEETQLTPYREVYVGHTPTINFDSMVPIRACEVILMDTGAGWPGGILTMMNLETGQIYQSSPVSDLYP
jgi:serine/threonine protein phosphatase 1